MCSWVPPNRCNWGMLSFSCLVVACYLRGFYSAVRVPCSDNCDSPDLIRLFDSSFCLSSLCRTGLRYGWRQEQLAHRLPDDLLGEHGRGAVRGTKHAALESCDSSFGVVLGNVDKCSLLRGTLLEVASQAQIPAESTILLDSGGGPRCRYFYMPLSDVHSYALITKDVTAAGGCACTRWPVSGLRTSHRIVTFLDLLKRCLR